MDFCYSWVFSDNLDGVEQRRIIIGYSSELLVAWRITGVDVRYPLRVWLELPISS